MSVQEETSKAPTVGWRFKCGVAIFALMVVMTFCVPMVAFSRLPAPTIAAVIGGIFITKKVLLVLTIAVMGRPGFTELKRIIGGYLPDMKSDVPVGRMRHAIGLFMFCFPIASGMLEPYVDNIWPGLRPNIWQYQLAEDIMLVVSVFVLGGNFWAKIRAVFVRTARVGEAGTQSDAPGKTASGLSPH